MTIEKTEISEIFQDAELKRMTIDPMEFACSPLLLRSAIAELAPDFFFSIIHRKKHADS
ncbi:hypothetical protein N9E57_00355 [Gammaproteobacteria bacterium]|nr:hypothetical protein [Gammaproteobacteria bacterium]